MDYLVRNPIKAHTAQDRKKCKKIMGTLGVEPRSLSLAYVQCGVLLLLLRVPPEVTR
jgi:hypothetical protein